MKNSLLRKIYDMGRPYIKLIILVTVLAFIINIGQVLKPYIVKVLIDDYISLNVAEKSFSAVIILGCAYIALEIIINLLDLAVRLMTNNLGESIVYDMRKKLYEFVEKANITFHDQTSTGKLFVRITNDVEDISNLFKDVLSSFFKDFLLIIFILAMMIYISIELSTAVFIVFPFVIIVSFILTKLLNRAYDISKNIRTNQNIFFAESIYGIKLIKIFNRQKEKQKECNDHVTKLYNSRKPTGLIEGLLPGFMQLFENISIALVVSFALNNKMAMNIDVGVIYLFASYIKKIFNPIRNIVDNVEVLQESIVSINKIYEILDRVECQEDFNKGKYITNIKGKIEFKNVSFSYNNKDFVLKDVSFVVNPGESIALVGKTGSGKTTIINLINRFYEVQEGEILLDGVNIKDINLHSLRKKVKVVLQDPFIFSRSIGENISLNEEISDKIIDASLKFSSSKSFVDKLPGKKEYIAKERGSNFSSGQKQLLAFARIFAHNPSVFILDEATANIDTTTEKAIQRAVDIISEDKTSIFIAHRLSTIVNVDKIIVLNGGRIIEMGSHTDLIRANGYYSKLYNSYYTALG